jgi:hypothetical protein
MDVVYHASGAALMALSNAKGAVGKAARHATANMGHNALIKAACNSNYRPLAEYISAQTGTATVITSRASFEALADRFEASILTAKASKSGGYRTLKDGTQAPNAALGLAMRLKGEVVEIVAAVAAHHATLANEKAAALIGPQPATV